MKTPITNLVLISMLVCSSFLLGRLNALSTTTQDNSMNLEAVNAIATTPDIFTPAVIIEGEVLPVVQLPEIEIVAEDEHSVHATLIDGEIVPYVDLPELNIEA